MLISLFHSKVTLAGFKYCYELSDCNNLAIKSKSTMSQKIQKLGGRVILSQDGAIIIIDKLSLPVIAKRYLGFKREANEMIVLFYDGSNVSYLSYAQSKFIFVKDSKMEKKILQCKFVLYLDFEGKFNDIHILKGFNNILDDMLKSSFCFHKDKLILNKLDTKLVSEDNILSVIYPNNEHKFYLFEAIKDSNAEIKLSKTLSPCSEIDSEKKAAQRKTRNHSTKEDPPQILMAYDYPMFASNIKSKHASCFITRKDFVELEEKILNKRRANASLGLTNSRRISNNLNHTFEKPMGKLNAGNANTEMINSSYFNAECGGIQQMHAPSKSNHNHPNHNPNKVYYCTICFINYHNYSEVRILN